MSRLLLAIGKGLYLFDTNLSEVDPRLVLKGVEPLSLATDPSLPNCVYCATYNRGLWRSEDAGETWGAIGSQQSYFQPRVSGGIDLETTTFVSVEPNAGSNGSHAVWIGTEPSKLYKSEDNGESFILITDFKDIPSNSTWSFPVRPDSSHVRWIAHGNKGELYISIEFGAFLRSFDNGLTFEDRKSTSPLDTHVLRTHDQAPNQLFAATGDGTIKAGHSWAESINCGNTWTYNSSGLNSMPYLYGMAINRQDSSDIKVAASSTPKEAHSNGRSSIFKMQNGIWIEDADGFPTKGSLIPVLASDIKVPGRWFALCNLGLFIKESDEQPWRSIAKIPEWSHAHPTCLIQLKL